MAYCTVSTSSHKIVNKWVASGVLLIHEGITDVDVTLGPSEPRFDSKEEANQHVYSLARKELPNNQKIWMKKKKEI